MSEAGSYAQVGYPGLRELIDRGAKLIEVLPPAEFDELHLPGAVNIPLRQIDEEHAAALDRTRSIVVYCWDGL